MRLLAIATGAAVIATDAGLNVSNQIAKSGTIFDAVVLPIIVIALATTVGAPLALESMRSKRWGDKLLGLFILAGVCVGLAFTFTQSIERVSLDRVTFLQKRAGGELASRQSRDTNMHRANLIDREIRELSTTVERECFGPVDYDPKVHNASNFPKCHPAYQQLLELKRERDGYRLAAQSQEVALWEVDEAAKAMALGLPFTAKTISVYRDWALPLALVCFTALFTWGAAGERPEFELDESVKAEQKAERYIANYRATTRRKPTQKKVMQETGVSQAVAKRLLAA